MKLRDIIGIILITIGLAACNGDTLTPSGNGGALRLSLPNVSTATRAVPSELYVPTAADFHLTVTSQSGRKIYDGAFTEDEIQVPAGEYTVSATYGSDELLGTDAPHYAATATATVTEGRTTSVPLNATVANALVSVRFGIDEAEHERFERYYSDYSLYVNIGQQGIAITRAKPNNSIYVQAGTNITLRFWGKLKMENGREVSKVLTGSDVPTMLNAADHAIVTLTLPDPESALTVSIAKVDIETVTLDETIPLSWLPVANVVPMHFYDEDGTLMGTNLLIPESYEGRKWRAVITNAAGTTVRTVEGTGSLWSYYFNNTNAWPYLPQGNYKASYYLFDEQDNASLTSSRDFTVPAPTVKVATGGYTSYSKYKEGDINSANLINGCTVYEPEVKLLVSENLLNNSKYNYSFTYTYDGAATSVPAGKNSYKPGDQANQAVRVAPHVIRADATFDGVSATDKLNLYITGLPYSLNLKSHDEWSATGGVDWYDNDVKLGGGSTGGQSISTSTSISIPSGTYFCVDYRVNVHNGVAGTTFSITCGNKEILSISESGRFGGNDDHIHEGTTSTVHDDSQYITTINCHNSYGAGYCCSHIYSLTFKYANP